MKNVKYICVIIIIVLLKIMLSSSTCVSSIPCTAPIDYQPMSTKLVLIPQDVNMFSKSIVSNAASQGYNQYPNAINLLSFIQGTYSYLRVTVESYETCDAGTPIFKNECCIWNNSTNSNCFSNIINRFVYNTQMFNTLLNNKITVRIIFYDKDTFFSQYTKFYIYEGSIDILANQQVSNNENPILMSLVQSKNIYVDNNISNVLCNN